MTGDYAKDTISVVKTLQIAVDTPKDSPKKDEVRDESLALITDYISRYTPMSHAHCYTLSDTYKFHYILVFVYIFMPPTLYW